ncbi:MAG: hypothetical protein J6R32_03355 [Bacteroidales bacterium]|nr:hypothetical protein [Bacteroidales bacterium]
MKSLKNLDHEQFLILKKLIVNYMIFRLILKELLSYIIVMTWYFKD